MFSFTKRKSLLEASNFLRRLVNQTSPNVPPHDGDLRADCRVNRSLPALLVPWEDDQPMVDEAAVVMTKDFSDRGISLVLRQPFVAKHCLLGLWLDRPRFILCVVRQNSSLGGGFWQLSTEIIRLVDPASSPEVQLLIPLATRLLPPTESSEESKSLL